MLSVRQAGNDTTDANRTTTRSNPCRVGPQPTWSCGLKIALYTCVTGGYDSVRTPRLVDPRIDYWCFTDRPDAIPSPWRAQPLETIGLDAKDSNRFAKMHPHRLPQIAEYDFTVYVDGSIEVIGEVHELVLECAARHGDIFLYDHPFRDCVYEEAIACARFGHDNVLTIAAQTRRYRHTGFPAHAGLCECNVIVRRRSPAVTALMEAWWTEYRRGAKRDQLSLGFAAQRSGVVLWSLGRSDPRYVHRYFQLHPHSPVPTSPGAMLRSRLNRALMALLPDHLLFGHETASRS